MHKAFQNGHHARCVLTGACFALLALATGPATAALAFPTAAVPDRELATMRGGLNVAGLELDLNARLRTYIDERLQLQTDLHLTRLEEANQRMNDRLEQVRVRTSKPRPKVASGADSIKDRTGTNSVRTEVISDRTTVVSSDVPASTSSNRGVSSTTSPGADGRSRKTTPPATVLQHMVDSGRVISNVINSADGLNIRQQVDVDVTVHNFRRFSETARAAIRARAIGRRLSGQ